MELTGRVLVHAYKFWIQPLAQQWKPETDSGHWDTLL